MNNHATNVITIWNASAKSLLKRHPWVYSGAICGTSPGLEDGDIARIEAEDGRFFGHAFYNGKSKIAARVFSWREGADPEARIVELLAKAIARRDGLVSASDAYRLVHGEADGLPGLVVDKYGDCLVVCFLALGMKRRQDAVLRVLNERLSPKGILEILDEDIQKKEHFSGKAGVLSGEVPETVVIRENAVRFKVRLAGGQKTGFYLDQRENRASIAMLARERRVLDVFSYSGGFTIPALIAGARSSGGGGGAKTDAVSIDASKPALALLAENLGLNGVAVSRQESIAGNAFEVLRELVRRGERFGLVVLDPPKLAPSRAQRDMALRAYKDMNLQAMKLMESGGFGAVFSCSQVIDLESLRETVRWAAIDAGREVRFLKTLGQPADHPVLASFPESEYLRGVLYEAD